jgi:hypothetical protein
MKISKKICFIKGFPLYGFLKLYYFYRKNYSQNTDKNRINENKKENIID